METAGAARATGAAERRKRRRGGGARGAVDQEAAHSGDGDDMASPKLLLVCPVAAVCGLRREEREEGKRAGSGNRRD